MEGTKKVSVIIPAYNESQGIASTLEELITYVDMNSTEIIVIDDGSTDGTADVVRQYPEVRLVVHAVNRGYGSAIKSGVKAAVGDIVVWYDADGQHRPEDMHKVVNEIMIKNLDYCVGIRGKDSYEEPSRMLGKAVLRMFLRLVSRQKVSDFNSGLRGYRREILMKYLSYLPKRFGASTVLTLLMQEENYNGGEVPITVRKRVGKSSVKQVRDGINSMILILNIVYWFHPIRILGGTGTLMIFAGLFYGILRAITWHTGFPVLSAILIIFGFQLLCFGLCSYQISCIRKERMEDKDFYLEMEKRNRNV